MNGTRHEGQSAHERLKGKPHEGPIDAASRWMLLFSGQTAEESEKTPAHFLFQGDHLSEISSLLKWACSPYAPPHFGSLKLWLSKHTHMAFYWCLRASHRLHQHLVLRTAGRCARKQLREVVKHHYSCVRAHTHARIREMLQNQGSYRCSSIYCEASRALCKDKCPVAYEIGLSLKRTSIIGEVYVRA